MLLVGGFGLAISALTVLGMSGAGESDAGVASGLFNTTQQVGGALGVAVLSTLVAARADDLVAGGQSVASALTGGFRLGFGIAAGLYVAAIILTVALLRQRPKAADLPEPVRPLPVTLPACARREPAGRSRGSSARDGRGN
jgi:sugar phosphate permease